MHFCTGYPTNPPGVYVYAASVPNEPFIPRPLPTVGTGVFVPPTPSATEQEIGALKQRVGLLEEDMRRLVAEKLARGKKARR